MRRARSVLLLALAVVAALVSVPAAAGGATLSTLTDHTCVITADGSVRCWGYDGDGQLGIGGDEKSSSAEPVLGLLNATDIAAGGSHTCAIANGGAAYCWGYGAFGQLGLGNEDTFRAPRAVSGGSGMVELAAGNRFTCARKNDATVWCWGDNSDQQLGGSVSAPEGLLPRQVPGLTGVTALAAGYEHTCALLADATVRCWGEGSRGQLGDGNSTESAAPVTVTGLTGITALAAGQEHTCALNAAGEAWCWGANSYGQVGDGSTDGRSSPVRVVGVPALKRIEAGTVHTCATDVDGGAWCWGEQEYGRLGNGVEVQAEVPTPARVVGLPASAMHVVAGDAHSCAALTSGAVVCWGQPEDAQTGNGATEDSLTPVTALGLTDVAATATSLSAGDRSTCVLTTAAVARCWGSEAFGRLGFPASSEVSLPSASATGLSGLSGVATGESHACAWDSAGTASCWGYGAFGQRGDGTTTPSQATPTAVGGLTAVNRVDVGHSHTCAIRKGTIAQRTIWCWGLNVSGQLGDGTLDNRSAATQVIGAASLGATDIATGDDHSCFLRQDSQVWCFGRNTEGRLGNGATTTAVSTPVQVAGLPSGSITGIAAGGTSSCALVSGAVWCWGGNTSGQLGNGSTTGSLVPVQVVGITDAVQISASASTACARLVDGSVRCWGEGFEGTLGNGISQRSSTPVIVSGITGATSISVGEGQACAVVSGTVRCWGDGGSGELGDGDQPGGHYPRQLVPAVVAGVTVAVPVAPTPAPAAPQAAPAVTPSPAPTPTPAPAAVKRINELTGQTLRFSRYKLRVTKAGSCPSRATLRVVQTVGRLRVTVTKTATVKKRDGVCELTWRMTVRKGTSRVTVTISGSKLKRTVLVIKKR